MIIVNKQKTNFILDVNEEYQWEVDSWIKSWINQGSKLYSGM